MKNVTVEEICDCPIECNSISYSFSLVSAPFNPEKLCPNSIGHDFLMKDFYMKRFPPQFVTKLIEIKTNYSTDTTDAKEYCKKNIQYRAEVYFKLAANHLSVTAMSRRLSFFDKMSAFGKLDAILTILSP